MKKQYFINANIVDPHNSINEIGGLIIGEDGKIEAAGKKVNTNNLPTREKQIDLKELPLFGFKIADICFSSNTDLFIIFKSFNKNEGAGLLLPKGPNNAISLKKELLIADGDISQSKL